MTNKKIFVTFSDKKATIQGVVNVNIYTCYTPYKYKLEVMRGEPKYASRTAFVVIYNAQTGEYQSATDFGGSSENREGKIKPFLSPSQCLQAIVKKDYKGYTICATQSWFNLYDTMTNSIINH